MVTDPIAPIIDPNIDRIQREFSDEELGIIAKVQPFYEGSPTAPEGDPLSEAIARAEADAAAQDAAAGYVPSPEQTDEEVTAAWRGDAQQQQTRSVQRGQVQNGDWRVKLQLAPNADYLYKSDDAGLLAPLAITDGVIFPYTPSITTSYKANYTPYDLTHSNYRGYFYQNSYVDPVQLSCTFTAQNNSQANYMLAVIHFFRSVTKMFYGQDTQRGAPPPLVFLSGLGEFQFNKHPCVVSNFSYSLPADVDYIRAGTVNQVNLNLTSKRQKQSVASNAIFTQVQRLANAFTTKGALPKKSAIPNLGLGTPTYVPTKMEISITLLPVQTRKQVSQEFSLQQFAKGDLITKGFW